MEEDAFVMEVRRAQELIFLARQGVENIISPQTLHNTPETLHGIPQTLHGIPETLHTIDLEPYSLEDSWLAGLIGPISIGAHGRGFYVSVDPHDISQRKVMLRPIRDKEAMARPITTEQRLGAIAKFDKMLEKGLPALVLSSVPWFRGAMIFAEYEGYSIQFRRQDRIPWRKARIVPTRTLKVVEDFGKPGLRTCVNLKKGLDIIAEHGFERVFEIIDHLPRAVLARILVFLTGQAAKIELPGVSREGYGIDYAVAEKALDVRVFHFFAKVCCLVPFAMTLNRNSARGFIIHHMPFIVQLRIEISNKLSINIPNKLIINTSNSMWLRIYPYWNKKGRALQQHQVEISRIIVEASNLRRGHIIDVTAGGGKTAIFCEVLRLLSLQNNLGPYINLYLAAIGNF